MTSIFSKYFKARFSISCLILFVHFSCNQKKRDFDFSGLQLNDIYKREINLSICHLDSILMFPEMAQMHYKLSRKYFKRAEPIMAFIDKANYKALNQANLLKVEEEDLTDVKIIKPFGYQVIEEMLFNDDSLDFNAVNDVVSQTTNRLNLIKKNSHFKFKSHHLIWMIRNQVARIALTGITGFDSPILEQSLLESQIIYQQLISISELYEMQFHDKDLYNKWINSLLSAAQFLKSEFNTFDRYSFIKYHTHEQLRLLVEIQKDWNVKFPFEMALDNDLKSLFSDKTFNIQFFSDGNYNAIHNSEISKIGKRLFNDKRFSINQNMSCATCHKAELAFTDGKKAFIGQQRNTPMLSYATFQQSFFYDGRSGSLEGQIVDVIENKNEFHSNLKHFVNVVKNDTSYSNALALYYDDINDYTVRNTISTYVRGLNKFNSTFDLAINNLKEEKLSSQEINGFNLFTGKAKCATCHFAPVFNGTIPPNFNETEFESIGVPSIEDSLVMDKDYGRFNVFKTEARKGYFKTPSIRNISITGPYMHNGVFNTLEEVMHFYNKGGGKGIGLDIENESLPSTPLNLSESEISDVISFMLTLKDN